MFDDLEKTRVNNQLAVFIYQEALATQSLQERYGSAQSNSISCRFASEAVRIMGARNKAW